MPPAAKTVGNYVNSSLAKVEALKAGYDEAIMLAPNGLIAECTGECCVGIEVGIAIEPDEDDRFLAQLTHRVVRQQDARRVGPMEIVEQDEERSGSCGPPWRFARGAAPSWPAPAPTAPASRFPRRAMSRPGAPTRRR